MKTYQIQFLVFSKLVAPKKLSPQFQERNIYIIKTNSSFTFSERVWGEVRLLVPRKGNADLLSSFILQKISIRLKIMKTVCIQDRLLSYNLTSRYSKFITQQKYLHKTIYCNAPNITLLNYCSEKDKYFIIFRF